MHLANGDIPVERSVLPPGEAGVDETVERMSQMAKGNYGARSAKIRALAINIINTAGVGDKDYYGYAKAIHEWVRDNIRYVKDPMGQETLSYPEETAFNSKAGDCDDKTILLMALLGSVGIQSYPVVVGVRPGRYSHVYANIIIPEGGRPGRHAGEHIPADPIMREWPLGQEAPAHKISQRKTYEHLAGLGAMLDGYQTGPSYLDQENLSSVQPALRARLVDTASRGEVLNAPKVDEPNTDELDQMFATAPAIAMTAVPWADLGPYGPVTGAEASGAYSVLREKRRVERVAGERSFTPRATRVTNLRATGDAPRPGGAPSRMQISKRLSREDDDLSEIGVYIDSIMGDALSGTAPASQVAAAAGLAVRRAQRARRTARIAAGFLPGMGSEVEGRAKLVVSKARALAAASQKPQLPAAAAGIQVLHRQGVIDDIDRQRATPSEKVRAIQIALYHRVPKPQLVPVRDAPRPRSLRPALFTRLPKGSVVSVRGLAGDGLGSWGKALVNHSRGLRQRASRRARLAVRRARLAGDEDDGSLGKWYKKITKPIQRTIKAVVPKPVRKVGAALALASPGALITTGFTSMLPGPKMKRVSYQAAQSAFGKNLGKKYIQAARATYIGGSAVAIAAPFTAAGQAAAQSQQIAAGWQAFGQGGAEAARQAMLATRLAQIGTTVVAGGQLAATVGSKVGSKVIEARKAEKEAEAAAAAGGAIQYTDENGRPISKAEYDRLMALYNGTQPLPTTNPYEIPTQVDTQLDPYGGQDWNDPTWGSSYGGSAAGGAAPFDSFGPQDMGPAYEMESATSDPQSFTTAVTAEGDEMPGADAGGDMQDPTLVDEDGEEAADRYYEGDEDTEGSAPRRRRRRKARRAEPEDTAEVEEAEEEPAGEDYEDEELPEEHDTDLDDQRVRPDRDVAGFGAMPSATNLLPLALLGLGAYLLLKKRA